MRKSKQEKPTDAEQKAAMEELIKKQPDEPGAPTPIAQPAGKNVSLPAAFVEVVRGITAILEQVTARQQFAADCESKPTEKAYAHVAGQLGPLVAAAQPIVDALTKGAGKK